MRYIDTGSLTIPGNWTTLARNGGYNPLWSYLKPQLEDIVGKKCWYNESINDGTSNPVDHFRPKTKNTKILEPRYASLDIAIWNQLNPSAQTGYPFLEFTESNYRYACGYANSAHTRENIDGITRGKWDFFPLQLGCNAATNPNDLKGEQHALLDPCNRTDPEFLKFDEFGSIQPSESILTNSWEYCRVKISIEVYHLMYTVISKKRKELWTWCENKIEILRVLYNKPNKSDEEQLSFDHIFKEFVLSMQKRSEYSAVVIDCVKHFRKKDRETYKWLHDVIPDELLIK